MMETEILDQLNVILCSILDLHQCCKHAQINGRGENFYSVHLMYDNFCTELSFYSDSLARYISKCGIQAKVFPQQIKECSVLHSVSVEDTSIEFLLGEINLCYEKLCNLVNETIWDLKEEDIEIPILCNLVLLLDEHCYKVCGHIKN